MKNSIILFLLFSIGANSQINGIKLPKGEEAFTVRTSMLTYDIHVLKDESIFFEEEPVQLHDMAKRLTLLKSKIREELRRRIVIFLNVDKRVNYAIVDRIKTELATAGFYKTIYKTASMDDKDLLKGIARNNHKSHFHIEVKEMITKGQEKENQRFADSIKALNAPNNAFLMPPPPPPPPLKYHDFEFRMYSNQPEVIEEILTETKIGCAILTNKGLLINSVVVKLTNVVEVKEAFAENDVILLYFDERLSYENYIDAIKTFKALKIHNVCEMSSEIAAIHEQSGIETCN